MSLSRETEAEQENFCNVEACTRKHEHSGHFRKEGAYNSTRVPKEYVLDEKKRVLHGPPETCELPSRESDTPSRGFRTSPEHSFTPKVAKNVGSKDHGSRLVDLVASGSFSDKPCLLLGTRQVIRHTSGFHP